MKTPANVQHQRGFTLVEILVVLAIIIILAGLGIGVSTKITERARKLQAINEVTSLIQAVDLYYDEYNRLPVPATAAPTGSGDLTIESSSGLMSILVGFDPVANPKKIPYFVGKTVKGRTRSTARGGLFYSPGSPPSVELFDPFRRSGSSPTNRHYYLTLDTNLDGQIQSPIDPSDIIYHRSAIAWSVGKDGKLGSVSSPAETRDNVQSW